MMILKCMHVCRAKTLKNKRNEHNKSRYYQNFGAPQFDSSHLLIIVFKSWTTQEKEMSPCHQAAGTISAVVAAVAVAATTTTITKQNQLNRIP